ncbi:MAG: T9SS type A sorting domain-containing protein [Bacteroidota bacterium]
MKRITLFHGTRPLFLFPSSIGILILLAAAFIPHSLQAGYCDIIMPQVSSANGCAQAQAAPYSSEGYTVYYLWARNSNGRIYAETDWSTTTALSFCPSNPGFYRLCAIVSGCRRMVEGGDVYVDNGTFPVEWLSIRVKQLGHMARLEWSTASELNASHFEVQRAANGETYQNLGRVEAAGNSQTVQVYQFMDALDAGMAGQRYTYRLKQVDMDGVFDFSSSVELSVQQQQGISLLAFPNPCYNQLHLRWESGAEVHGFTLINAKGALVRREEFEPGSFPTDHSLDLSRLPAGLYVIRLQSATGQLSQKFIKK